MNQILKYTIIIFGMSSLVIGVVSQGCDTSSNSTQCNEGQICLNNMCQTAVSCNSGADCSFSSNLTCAADFCQPWPCTATGQCVYGQKCSQDEASKHCVYPVILKVEENTEVVLNFTEPGSGGRYEEITWSKDGTGSSLYGIVYLRPSVNEGKPQYYNEYCSGTSPCDTSSKVELNVDTGELTIYSVNLSDKGFYYYKFYMGNGGSADTGRKYEIHVEVYVSPKQEDLSLTGIPDDYVKVGTDLDLNCTISRIKPEAAEMYWLVGRNRDNGSMEQTTNDDGTFNQSNTFPYKVVKEDEGKPITCVVVPKYGDSISLGQTVNPGYGPTGHPYLQPIKSYKQIGEMVVLTCNNPIDDGNPDCDTYTWSRIEGSDGIPLSVSNILEFRMNESLEGNYTCTCGNNYSTSDVSNTAEVIFLIVPEPTESSPFVPESGPEVGIIIGCTLGGLAVVGISAAVILLIIRRNNTQTNGGNKGDSAASGGKTFLDNEDHQYEVLRKQPVTVPTYNSEEKDDDGYEKPVTRIRQVYHPAKFPSEEGPKQTGQPSLPSIYQEINEKEMQHHTQLSVSKTQGQM